MTGHTDRSMIGMRAGIPGLDTFERTVETLARTAGVTRVVAAERAVRAVEFGLVGASGAAVNTGVFVATVRRGAYFLPGLFAFWAAVAWTFGLNWTLTFDKPEGALRSRFARYVGVCAVGYLVYTGALTAAIEVAHLAYPLAALGAIATAGTWNFVGAERYAMH